MNTTFASVIQGVFPECQFAISSGPFGETSHQIAVAYLPEPPATPVSTDIPIVFASDEVASNYFHDRLTSTETGAPYDYYSRYLNGQNRFKAYRVRAAKGETYEGSVEIQGLDKYIPRRDVRGFMSQAMDAASRTEKTVIISPSFPIDPAVKHFLSGDPLSIIRLDHVSSIVRGAMTCWGSLQYRTPRFVLIGLTPELYTHDDYTNSKSILIKASGGFCENVSLEEKTAELKAALEARDFAKLKKLCEEAPFLFSHDVISALEKQVSKRSCPAAGILNDLFFSKNQHVYTAFMAGAALARLSK